jgi:hypothetical protein
LNANLDRKHCDNNKAKKIQCSYRPKRAKRDGYRGESSLCADLENIFSLVETWAGESGYRGVALMWSVTATVLVLSSRIYLISGGLGPGRSGAVSGWSRESELLLWVLSREIATIVLVLIKLQFIFSEAEVESRQNGGGGGGGGVECNSKESRDRHKNFIQLLGIIA